MKNLGTKESNYSLHTNENFKKELESDITDIVQKISELFIHYFQFITENVKFKKSTFSRFIIIRGLDTIIHVFQFLLLYTKNIDLTYFHCQKSFYFYVEFVGQISEDEKMFLQLSSLDATTYVYKKTIFDISSELKKSNEVVSDCTRIKINVINDYIYTYKTILVYFINNEFSDKTQLNIVDRIYSKLNSLEDKSKITKFNDIIEKIYDGINNKKLFLTICDQIIKKYVKNTDLLNNNANKFLSDEFKDKLNDSPEKFIQWFASQ